MSSDLTAEARAALEGIDRGPWDVPFGDARMPERFWIRVVRGDSCWFWTGKTDRSGYGSIKRNGKWVGTHRFILLCIGINLSDYLVMHACDEPACVNPAHLSLGTASDNQMDSVNKGRQYWARRTECPSGHPYAEHGVTRSGKRYCRKCQVSASIRYQRKRKALRALATKEAP